MQHPEHNGYNNHIIVGLIYLKDSKTMTGIQLSFRFIKLCKYDISKITLNSFTMIYTLHRRHLNPSEWKSRNWNLNLIKDDVNLLVFPDSTFTCYIYKWSFFSLYILEKQLQDKEKNTDLNPQIGMIIYWYTGTLRVKDSKGLVQLPACKSQKKNPDFILIESALWAAKYKTVFLQAIDIW